MRGQRARLLERAVARKNKLPTARRRTVRRWTAHAGHHPQLVRGNVQTDRVTTEIPTARQRVLVATANR